LLFGRSADIVVADNEVMWKVCENGWLYLVEGSTRTGTALVTIAVSSLDATMSEIAQRGIEAPEVVVISGSGRKAPYEDSEGNVVHFIEVLQTST
jgi:hypothetical protein